MYGYPVSIALERLDRDLEVSKFRLGALRQSVPEETTSWYNHNTCKTLWQDTRTIRTHDVDTQVTRGDDSEGREVAAGYDAKMIPRRYSSSSSLSMSSPLNRSPQ